MRCHVAVLCLLAVAAASAEPSKKATSSSSFQEVDFGLSRGGISKYRTELKNEQVASLFDRRKTPNPPARKHKREASKPKKYSSSFQEFNFGLPRGGISK